jgi:hypothetical protein
VASGILLPAFRWERQVGQYTWSLPSVVVNDLNIRSAILGINEADSPLLVDADAVLPHSIVL